jgi:hypothetical protein
MENKTFFVNSEINSKLEVFKFDGFSGELVSVNRATQYELENISD